MAAPSATTNVTIPGPKGIPLLGNARDLGQMGIIEYYYDLWHKYGDTVKTTLGPLQVVTVVHPDQVQHVMVKNPALYTKGISHNKLRDSIGDGILTLEGEKWFQQRKLMQPLYTPKGIRQFADIMNEEAQNLIARWRLYPADKVIDINQEMARVTMSVISRSMFSIDIGDDFKEAADGLHYLLEHTSKSSNRLFEVPMFIPTEENRRFKAANNAVKEFMTNIIAERRQLGDREDLLSLLMNSLDAETGKPMSDDQLRNEVIITFFAGHETTASLLTWTFFLLDKHPDIEMKLHEELERVLHGRTPTLDDLEKMIYTRQIFDEVLRLYSPVAIMARDAQAASEIDGYPVPKGAMVLILPYATHRHPDFWEKPLGFYPDHFTPDQVASRPRYAYYPFGAGQRICIGAHFAQMEAALVMGDLAQQFRLRAAKENDGAFKFMGVVRPKNPIYMTIESRTR